MKLTEKQYIQQRMNTLKQQKMREITDKYMPLQKTLTTAEVFKLLQAKKIPLKDKSTNIGNYSNGLTASLSTYFDVNKAKVKKTQDKEKYNAAIKQLDVEYYKIMDTVMLGDDMAEVAEMFAKFAEMKF